MAWVKLVKEIWTKQIKKPTSGNLEKLMNVDVLEKPVNTIVKMVQTKQLGKEIRILSANSVELKPINQSSLINFTLSWIVMVCYELLSDWGNPDSLKAKLVIWFFRNKANIRSNNTMVPRKYCPWWKRNDLKKLKVEWILDTKCQHSSIKNDTQTCQFS